MPVCSATHSPAATRGSAPARRLPRVTATLLWHWASSPSRTPWRCVPGRRSLRASSLRFVTFTLWWQKDGSLGPRGGIAPTPSILGTSPSLWMCSTTSWRPTPRYGSSQHRRRSGGRLWERWWGISMGRWGVLTGAGLQPPRGREEVQVCCRVNPKSSVRPRRKYHEGRGVW